LKILLGSHHFLPSTGGIETTSDLLAREFVRQGHEVRVVTQTQGAGSFPFAVIRRPGALQLFRQIVWSDVFLQNNISLRTLWPILFVRRPLFITHQTWIADAKGRTSWHHRVKRFVLRFAKSLAISHAIAEKLPTPSLEVGNPYDDEVFRNLSAERTRDLIYVGRLVSDKGVDILLEALAVLRDAGLSPRLTIVGGGPERARLEVQTLDLGLQSQVEFVGNQRSRQIAEILNRHRILIVPSRLPEPFGIVAIEGIACGCVVVGSAQGGLPDAIGPGGVTFRSGDAAALASVLQQLLGDPVRLHSFARGAAEHVAQFKKARVAEKYLKLLSTEA
jgi:glycogen synthase